MMCSHWNRVALTMCILAGTLAASQAPGLEFAVELGNQAGSGGLDGRVLVMISGREEPEPRLQVRPGVQAIQILGVDVENLLPGASVIVDSEAFGYPATRLDDLAAGTYWVQALLHRYETFSRSDGHVVKLPMDRGEGQRWNRAPGNLYSLPRKVELDPAKDQRVTVRLDQVIPAIEKPEDTKYIRHIELRSELLSEFWGRPMVLGAHVLVPEGFEENPNARYPLMIFHGHFPENFGGFRTDPPDPDLECEYSERFKVDCYNRIVQQEAYDFYRQWTSPDFPRFLAIEIQHANPYYDDSYAVNSANLGPYGDAITYELIPHIEETFRGLGEPWARFLYGGSTGGWEALAAQIFYPEEYNGAFGACPDPVDFREYTQVNLYEDQNAYYADGDFHRIARPAHRDYLGRIEANVVDYNHLELVLGSHGRSGDQYDIWQAVYSPVGDNGYPRPIWNKRTGAIDHEVADYWRENYDLRFILERDWESLGPKLEGKLHFYCGDMDNYYLNNAVYLMEEFLEGTTTPYYGGEFGYGDRAEHCWNGDNDNPNHLTRLRYNTMYLPKILRRIEKTAPEGADLTSWRY